MSLNSKSRLIGLLGLILLTAFSSIILLNYISARGSMKTEIVKSSLPLLRENIYTKILRDLLPPMQIASLMANDNFLVGWVEDGEKNVSEIIDYLDRIRTEYGFHSAFFISEASRRYFHPEGVHKVISPDDDHDVWYFDFIASGEKFDLDVDSDEVVEDLITIFINNRLENSTGELLGVTGIGIEMKGFSGFLAEQQEQFDRVIYLIDDSGIVQAHSDLSQVEKVDIHQIEGLDGITGDIINNTQEAYTGQYKYQGNTIVLTSRYIPEIDWYVIVEHDEHAAMAEIRRHLYESLIIGIVAFVLVLTLSIITISRYDSRMEAMAITDALTGVANRRALEAALPRMLYRRNRQDGSVSLLLIDIDNFKGLNDEFGHQAGDGVLESFARDADAVIRQDDLLVRWGGDEFIIISESNIAGARRIAEEIMRRFSESEIRVTLSIGIAEASSGDDSVSLMKKADSALYDAKKHGRNRIALHSIVNE
jgi:diguanylate cyclase (GGDEF)-like protein